MRGREGGAAVVHLVNVGLSLWLRLVAGNVTPHISEDTWCWEDLLISAGTAKPRFPQRIPSVRAILRTLALRVRNCG